MNQAKQYNFVERDLGKGEGEQVFTSHRWYMDYLANRRSETGPWNYVKLRACLVNREMNEAIHREIGADVALEITPPDVRQRAFDDEPTCVDTKRTVAIDIEE